MKRGSYKSRPLALLLVLWPAIALAANHAHGLVLPGGAEEVGENRYRSSDSYEDTLKFFDKTYRGIPRKEIVNQPGLQAMHFESVDAKSGWEGFNVYQRGTEVRIYVIPRAEKKKSK